MDIEKVIDELTELYLKVQEERNTTKDREYWQGRKDGLRVALALLEPEGNWDKINASSYGFRDEEYVRVKKFMEDARYNIAAILYELQEDRRFHIQTKMNLVQWIDLYDRMSKEGITLEVNDACDSIPGFQWKLR